MTGEISCKLASFLLLRGFEKRKKLGYEKVFLCINKSVLCSRNSIFSLILRSKVFHQLCDWCTPPLPHFQFYIFEVISLSIYINLSECLPLTYLKYRYPRQVTKYISFAFILRIYIGFSICEIILCLVANKGFWTKSAVSILALVLA